MEQIELFLVGGIVLSVIGTLCILLPKRTPKRNTRKLAITRNGRRREQYKYD